MEDTGGETKIVRKSGEFLLLVFCIGRLTDLRTETMKFLTRPLYWIPRIFTNDEVPSLVYLYRSFLTNWQVLLHWGAYKIHVTFNTKSEIVQATFGFIDPTNRADDVSKTQ